MSEKLRIVFMGTPDFAVESLDKLLDSEHKIVGVITSPDKPAGRGKVITPPPVKIFAEKSGVKTILQPPNLKDPEFLKELRNLGADLQVVVAFRMLPEEVWSMPPKGTINLHASLLPDYRGAAPINRAIMNGEKETGVTTFFIEKEIDTGKIIFRDPVPIDGEMDAGQLHDLLMVRGADLLVRTVNAVASGKYQSVGQEEWSESRELKTAPKIYRDDCRIDWKKSPAELHNFIRGLSPYPAAWTEITDGKEVFSLKVFKARPEYGTHDYSCGHLLSDGKNYLKVAVKDGVLSLLELQLAGKKKMPVGELLRGFKDLSEYRIH